MCSLDRAGDKLRHTWALFRPRKENVKQNKKLSPNSYFLFSVRGPLSRLHQHHQTCAFDEESTQYNGLKTTSCFKLHATPLTRNLCSQGWWYNFPNVASAAGVGLCRQRHKNIMELNAPPVWDIRHRNDHVLIKLMTMSTLNHHQDYEKVFLKTVWISKSKSETWYFILLLLFAILVLRLGLIMKH